MRQVAAVILCALTLFSGTALTQGAIAQGAGFAVAPDDCTIEPIEMPEPGDVGDLATPSPTPTPVMAGDGTPAEEAVTEAITERIEQSIACQNAGDVLRLLANFTERWVSEHFAGYDLVFYGRFQEAAANPEPLPEDEQIELVSVDDALVQDDGSVIVSVTTRAGGAEQTSLVVLVEDPGDWLIDGGAIVPDM